MNIYKTLRISNKTNEDVTHIVMNKIMIRQKWASCVVVEQIMLVRIWRKEYWIFNLLSPWNVQEQWECEWGDNISGQSCSWTVGPQTILGWATQGLLRCVYPDEYKVSQDDEEQKQWMWLLDRRRYLVGRYRAWLLWWGSQHSILGWFQTEKSERDCDWDLMSLELMKLRKEKQKWREQQYRNPGRWEAKKGML